MQTTKTSNNIKVLDYIIELQDRVRGLVDFVVGYVFCLFMLCVIDHTYMSIDTNLAKQFLLAIDSIT